MGLDTSDTDLSSVEYDSVGLAIFDCMATYPDIPDGIKLDYQKLDGPSRIGFITTSGGKYLKQYVTGGFRAQLPFQICYKCVCTNNQQHLDAQKVVDGMAAYLEKKKPLLSGYRETEKILMDSTTFRSAAEPDGSTVYVRTGRLIYEKT